MKCVTQNFVDAPKHPDSFTGCMYLKQKYRNKRLISTFMT